MKSFFSNLNSTESANSTTLKAIDFFTDENPEGYFSKEGFKTYAKSLLRNEPNHFGGFIKELKQGSKFNWDLNTRKDRSQRPYAFPQFFHARAIKGYKIIMNPEMQRFIDDYAEGKISIDFDADDLLKIAFND